MLFAVIVIEMGAIAWRTERMGGGRSWWKRGLREWRWNMISFTVIVIEVGARTVVDNVARYVRVPCLELRVETTLLLPDTKLVTQVVCNGGSTRLVACRAVAAIPLGKHLDACVQSERKGVK